MAQAIRRHILGSRIDSPICIDQRLMEKIWKQMDRIVKYCQTPKMNLKTSPPYILDILPALYQLLREILINYEERLHILNDIEYFRIYLENIFQLSTKIIECFKQAGQMIYDEQSIYRKYFRKFSLYFSHNLMELKSLFKNGMYQGERYSLTKQEAKDFWMKNFNQRIIIPWEEFKEKLNQVHPIITDDEAIALRNMIDLTNNNHVSIFEFDVLTRLFYPWSSLLTNWKLLTISHPGYMEFMTYDEVKIMLTKCIDKPGSYLFRLSCTRLGQWAIGYVSTDSTVLQTIPQTKTLIQSLIDGEREGYYKYPLGKNIHIDLSVGLKSTEFSRIDVSEEQYTMYSNMNTSFELCKICSVNNKNSKIQPCGHLICQNCLISWQNKTSSNSKSLSLCPFCRSEIKGFESIIINPFDKSNDTTPPPIPPRPINFKSINSTNFRKSLPPPSLHNNNEILLIPLQSLSSNDDDSSSKDFHCITKFQTIDDVRNHLLSENNFDQTRIEAALILTHGLVLSKQYELSKIFLNQVKFEYEQ